jgi:hypothetical protein
VSLPHWSASLENLDLSSIRDGVGLCAAFRTSDQDQGVGATHSITSTAEAVIIPTPRGSSESSEGSTTVSVNKYYKRLFQFKVGPFRLST